MARKGAPVKDIEVNSSEVEPVDILSLPSDYRQQLLEQLQKMAVDTTNVELAKAAQLAVSKFKNSLH